MDSIINNYRQLIKKSLKNLTKKDRRGQELTWEPDQQIRIPLLIFLFLDKLTDFEV